MTEYIERKGMREVLEKASISTRFADIPKTADVRNERYGEWLNDKRNPYIIGVCSNCGCQPLKPMGRFSYPYCPNCGAKMDGKDGNKND